MIDKSRTIKNASDTELDAILIRLRKELEVQNLIGDIVRKTKDGYVPYDQQQGISTEISIESLYHMDSADKTKTIKNATDKELDDLLIRLRKENDALNIIVSLKRQSMNGYVPYDQQLSVSTEAPIESMYHIGIPGMKWGHRKAASEDYNKKLQLKGKKISEMSNAELKALNERLQLERQYKDLTSKEINPGAKFIKNIITNSANELAAQYLKKYAIKGISALIKKAVK